MSFAAGLPQEVNGSATRPGPAVSSALDRPLELIAALAAWHPLHRAEVSVVLARASASLWSGFGLRTVIDAYGT